jgi:hypothetical protein
VFWSAVVFQYIIHEVDWFKSDSIFAIACSLACTFSSTCSIESHPPNSRGVTILSLGCSCTFSCGETVGCFVVFFAVGVADGVGVTTCSLGVFPSGKTHGVHGRFFHF